MPDFSDAEKERQFQLFLNEARLIRTTPSFRPATPSLGAVVLIVASVALLATGFAWALLVWVLLHA